MTRPAYAHDAWIRDEPGLAPTFRCVVARALRRPARVFLLAVIATGALVAMRALKKPSSDGTLFFSMDEGHFSNSDVSPPPPRDIRKYIATVALSRERVTAIMRRHKISTAWLERDPIGATQAFREELTIDVSRNYFIFERQRGDEPRSALVTVQISGGDSDRTRAILHEVSEAIMEDQAQQRTRELADARSLFDVQIRERRARIRSLQEMIDRNRRDARSDRAAAITARARIAALEAEIRANSDQILDLQWRAAGVAFSGAAETQQLGLRFELVDERVVVSAMPLNAVGLAVRGFWLFPFVFLVAAAVVGALEGHVYTAEDLRAWRLPVFGVLRRFPGDDACSLRARSHTPRA